MDLVDFLEAWWVSVRALVEASGGSGRFDRWTWDGGMNPVCAIGLKRAGREGELFVFANSEAELAYIDADGVLVQDHVADLSKSDALGDALNRLLSVAIQPND